MEGELPAGIQNGALCGALVVNVLDMEPAQQFSLDRNRLVQSQRLFAVENPLPVDSVAGIFRPETRRRENRSHRREDLNVRSEEHTSELQSLMRISYAVFCLKKKQYISQTKEVIYLYMCQLVNVTSIVLDKIYLNSHRWSTNH